MLSDFSLQLACQHSHRPLQTVAERSVWQGLALAIPRSGRRYPHPPRASLTVTPRAQAQRGVTVAAGRLGHSVLVRIKPIVLFFFLVNTPYVGVVTLSGAFGKKKNPQSLHRLSDCQRAAVRHARDDDAGRPAVGGSKAQVLYR